MTARFLKTCDVCEKSIDHGTPCLELRMNVGIDHNGDGGHGGLTTSLDGSKEWHAHKQCASKLYRRFKRYIDGVMKVFPS